MTAASSTSVAFGDQVAECAATARAVRSGESGRAVFIAVDGEDRLERTARQVAAAIGRSGMLCLAGGHGRSSGAPPLQAFAEVGAALSWRGALPHRSELGSFAAALDRVVPGWATHPPTDDTAFPPPVLGEALMRLLRRAAPEGCALVLTDLHRADAETLAVLEYVCDTIADSSLFLVGMLAADLPSAARATVESLTSRSDTAQLVRHRAAAADDAPSAPESGPGRVFTSALLSSALFAGTPRLQADVLDQALSTAVLGGPVSDSAAGTVLVRPPALTVPAGVLHTAGAATSPLAALAPAHRAAAARSLPFTELAALHQQGVTEMVGSGRLDLLHRARRRSVELGAFRTRSALDLQLVLGHCLLGDAASARTTAVRADGDAAARQLDGVRQRIAMVLPHIDALLGDRMAVERDIAAVPPAVRVDPAVSAELWGGARAVCSLLLEDHDAAENELATAARLAARATAPIPGPHPWRGYWALLGAVRGSGEPRPATAEGSPLDRALFVLAEAVVAGHSGDGRRATAVVESFDRDAFPWTWHRQLARRLVAQAALRDGWGTPQAWLGEAAEFFDGFAAPPVAQTCRALADLAERNARRAIPRQRVSPRERDVLGLLAEGSSNRDIAQRLRISPRTVEKHVESLGHKLGADGRSSLIAMAAREIEAERARDGGPDSFEDALQALSWEMRLRSA